MDNVHYAVCKDGKYYTANGKFTDNINLAYIYNLAEATEYS
jgi:hypothetical protein